MARKIANSIRRGLEEALAYANGFEARVSKLTTLADIDAARERLAQWHRSDPKASALRLGEVNWTYDGDNHVPAVQREAVIVMGFNAGAGNGATETKLSPSEKKWRTRCERLTAGFCERFVLAELILVASLNKAELRERYGDLAPAFEAGADVNRTIIAYHRPRLIFQAGIDDTDLATITPYYGLEHVCTIARPEHPTHRLLKHYRMADGTPWIAFRHFAGLGFSNADLEAIRNYARGLLAN